LSETKLTYLEAVFRVLHEAGRPLTTRELVDSAIASGLIRPGGKTPEATMGAVLYRTIQGESPLRKLEEPGTLRAKPGTVRWALKSWPDSE
jgi:HB1, ASXL, restriction endonuclease HTH domain